MKYTVLTTRRFEKAFKLCKKRNYPMHLLQKVVNQLAETGSLPQEYYPHKLSGLKGNNTWECHIQANWLLIWNKTTRNLLF